MYNGVGLQTPRGSGSTGYVQTNNFFLKPKVGKTFLDHSAKGYETNPGNVGVCNIPNMGILERERKRQIVLQLLVLEDKLTEQGYTNAEIADRLEETRKTLEAPAGFSEALGGHATSLPREKD